MAAAVVFIIALGAGLWSQTLMGEVAPNDKAAALELVKTKVEQIAEIYNFNVAKECTQENLVYEFVDGKHQYTCNPYNIPPNSSMGGGNKRRKKSKKTKKKKITKKRKTMKKK